MSDPPKAPDSAAFTPAPPQRNSAWLWLLTVRIAALIALAVSAALFVDYTSADPSFCSVDSGCGEVKRSMGFLFNGLLPVPLLGLLGFGFLLVVSLMPPRTRDKLLPPVALIGGVTAAVLIVLQALVIKQYCLYCMIVDVTALVAAGAAQAYGREAKKQPVADKLRPWAWAVMGAVAVAAPLTWPRLRPQPEVPKEIRAFYVPGKINVVEFADFQCPFCRMLHPKLTAMIKDYAGQVNFVRLNMPLERHIDAMDAAKAYVCGKAQGKGEEMADALFEAEDISFRGGRRLAVQLALDMRAFDACIQDPKTQRAIEREAAILRGAGFQGLPTTYIGGRLIVGVQADEVFLDAFEAAASGENDRGLPGWLFALLTGAALAAIAFVGRVRQRSAASEPAVKDEKATT